MLYAIFRPVMVPVLLAKRSVSIPMRWIIDCITRVLLHTQHEFFLVHQA